MVHAMLYETWGRANNARRRALIAPERELELHNRSMKARTAARLQRFFSAKPAGPLEQRFRAFAAPPALRNCLRCSKIECSTS
jgi:hypothetical protein